MDQQGRAGLFGETNVLWAYNSSDDPNTAEAQVNPQSSRCVIGAKPIKSSLPWVFLNKPVSQGNTKKCKTQLIVFRKVSIGSPRSRTFSHLISFVFMRFGIWLGFPIGSLDFL
jgi:hypothetical protein